MKQIVEEAHRRFESYKDRAEQHDFPRIFLWESRENLAYKDLLEHPDAKHLILYLRLIHKFVSCQDLISDASNLIRDSKASTRD